MDSKKIQLTKQGANVVPTLKTNSLTAFLANFPESSPEKAVLKIKYSAPSFASYSETEILDISEIVLLKISVITGWELPVDRLLKLLVDQLSKHVIESYPNFNPNEIEYAFRQYALRVKEWGKKLNLIMFDQVLAAYTAQRAEASRLEESIALASLPAPPPPPPLSPAETIDLAYGLWQFVKKTDLILPGTFQALVDDKKIEYPMPRAKQVEYMKQAQAHVEQYLREDRDFFKDKDRTEWEKNYARKLVVADYFKSISEPTATTADNKTNTDG